MQSEEAQQDGWSLGLSSIGSWTFCNQAKGKRRLPTSFVERKGQPPRMTSPMDDHDKEPRYILKMDAPDVIVVVGGTEFEEYSRHLCSFSDYFHAALRPTTRDESSYQPTTTTMTTTTTTTSIKKRLEFPNKDPMEWELVRTVLRPFGTKIGQDNVTTLVPWLDALCCQEALQECDTLLHSEIVPLLYHSLVTLPPLRKARYSKTKEVWMLVSKASTPFPDFFSNPLSDPKIAFRKLLEIIDVSIRYQLVVCKQGCFRVMESILTQTIVAMKDLTGRAQVATLLATHEEFRTYIWKVLKDVIPTDMKEQLPCDDVTLLESGAWSGILLSALLAEAMSDDEEDDDDDDG